LRKPNAFYDYPADHWIHLRTTNPIESTFSTVRDRTEITRGAALQGGRSAMAFKLIKSAETRWRAVNGAHLVALARRRQIRRRQTRRTTRRSTGRNARRSRSLK